MTSHQRGCLLPPAAIALVAGVFAGRNIQNVFLSFAACVLSALAVLLLCGRFRFFACIVFCTVLGVFLGSLSFHPALPPEKDYQVRGIISDEVSTGSFGQVRIYLSDVELNGSPYSAGAYWTFYIDIFPQDLRPGKEVSFFASLYHPRGAVNPDGYDFRESLLQRGVNVGLYGQESLSVKDPGRFSWLGTIARIRHDLSQSLITVLGDETGSYASALLLGMRSLIPSEDRQAFSRLGIAHILSVSGFHVGILVGFLSFIFRLFHLSQRVRIFLYSVILFFYIALCGMSQPVIRASLLLLLTLEGRILNRPRTGIHLLCAVLFLMTLVSPVQVTSASFQLTFFAMAGLIWFSPLSRHFRPFRSRILSGILESLILTFGIQLGLLLPELFFFQRLPILVFLVNLPAMLVSSFLTLVFWIILILLPLPGLSGLLSGPLSSFTGFLLSVVRRFGSLPGLTLWFHSPTILTAAGMILLFTGFCFYIRIRPFLRSVCLFIGSVSLIISLFPLPHTVTEYIQFSAGNADAAVLWDRDKVYVIDTGEADGTLSSFLLSRRLIPDAVILTHLHADHAGGLRSMLDDGIPVRLLYLPEGAETALIHPDFPALLQELRNNGTEIRTLSRGDSLSLPSGSLTVLWPEKEKIRPGQDANNYSLVTRLILNGTVLLHTGDITGSYEQYCASRANILKAAHHGSASSTLPDFLTAVSPDTVILSARHLSRQIAFQDRIPGAAVYGTPECGAVTVLFEENGYTVIPFLKQ